MKASELESFLHREIPSSSDLGVKIISLDSGRVVLSAPLNPNHNHMGTAFGGSLATLMILAGYCWLFEKLANQGPNIHVILKRSDIRYKAPVKEDLKAVCPDPDPQEYDDFLRTFQRRGLGRITLRTFIEIGPGIAAEMEGEFVAQRGIS